MRRILALTLALAALGATGNAQAEGWWDDLFQQKQVTLAAVLEDPVAHRGMDVTMVVQFQELGRIDNPYYTKFDRENFLNFSVWPDEAALWAKTDYDRTFPYMFIPRQDVASRTIKDSRIYDRFRIVGRVESVFRGSPWIEVRSVEPLAERVTEPSLIHMVKGFTFKKTRRFDAAAAEFLLANVDSLPRHVRKRVLRERGVCLAAADRPDEAMEPLAKAIAIDPDDRNLKKMYDHCKQKAAVVRKPAAPVETTAATKDG